MAPYGEKQPATSAPINSTHHDPSSNETNHNEGLLECPQCGDFPGCSSLLHQLGTHHQGMCILPCAVLPANMPCSQEAPDETAVSQADSASIGGQTLCEPEMPEEDVIEEDGPFIIPASFVFQALRPLFAIGCSENFKPESGMVLPHCVFHSIPHDC